MSLDDLLNLANARMRYLEQMRTSAAQQGDVNTIYHFEGEIAETQDTINKLQTLVT